MAKIIEYKGMELEFQDFRRSHANGGQLPKLWVRDRLTGRIFLIKGNSLFNTEPFGEKLAYIIGKDLGIDVLEYDLIKTDEINRVFGSNMLNCRYASICEKIDRKGCSITSVAEVKRARNVISEHKVTNKDVMYELLPKSYIDTMFLFDAIIGNSDRHYGNVHMLRNTKGEFSGAPLFDNGASLLSNAPLLFALASNYKVGETFNSSYTIDKKHDAQVATIDTLDNVNFNIASKTIDILNDIEPTLNLMSHVRADIIKKYIVYRLHKYLGMLKHNA